MTFVRANALGWAPFELLTSTQMNVIDSQMPFALDGAAGGTYSPSALLVWNERWTFDASGGAAAPGVTVNILSEAEQRALQALGGLGAVAADSGDGIKTTGGLNTGSGDAGEGIFATGGENTSSGLGGHGGTFFGGAAGTAQAGSGIQGTGGGGPVPGVGITAVGGTATGTNVDGAAGSFIVGGAALGTGDAGAGLVGGGGAAPGVGDGGRGVFGLGGASVSGADGVGGWFDGGGGGGGDGMGVVALGAGAAVPSQDDNLGLFAGGGVNGGTAIVAVPNADGNGVESQMNGAGGAFVGLIGDDGPGLSVANTGLGGGYMAELFPDATAPIKAPLHLGTQDADPTSPLVGDIMFAGSGHAGGERMRIYHDAFWSAVVTSNSFESIKGYATYILDGAGGITGSADSRYALTAVLAVSDTVIRYTLALAIPADEYQVSVSLTRPTGSAFIVPIVVSKGVGTFDVKVFDVGDAVTNPSFLDFGLATGQLDIDVQITGFVL